MIYQVEDGFVIASNHVWLPGCYESERAAKYAFRFSYKDLHNLQEEKNKTTKIITFKDLQELRTKIKKLS